MIWTAKSLHPSTLMAAPRLAEKVKSPESTASEENANLLAIVGGGPKGFYALQRLIDRYRNHGHALPDVTVHWFNTSNTFGSGPNFDPRQPEYLLTNNPIGTLSCYTAMYSIPGESPSLAEWIQARQHSGATVTPADYTSRALVGHYLADATINLLDHLPPGMTVKPIVAEVRDIMTRADGYWLALANRVGELPHPYRSILLATGHSYHQVQPEWQAFAENHPKAQYFTEAYPIECLKVVPPDTCVGIRGIGLTFVDAVLALTEGRGGRFVHKNNRLEYLPSGREPRCIFPFSRTNLPLLPRGASGPRYRLRFIHQPWIDSLLPKRGHIDFMNDIWPVLEREAHHAYYRTQFGDFQTPDSLMERTIAAIPKQQRFSLDKLLFDPMALCGIEARDPHQRMADFLRYTIHEAVKGESGSALMASAAVWREAIPLVAQLYQNGGFSPPSQQRFDQRYYRALCRTSFGPPLHNFRKISGLVDAGYLHFPFGAAPLVVPDTSGQYFIIRDGVTEVSVSTLVDAQVARPDLSKFNSPFYVRLQANGLIVSMNHGGYQPGCAQLSEKGQLLDASGEAHDIFAYGTPTEGFTLDNDTLSPSRHDFGSLWADHALRQLHKPEIPPHHEYQ